MKKLFLLLIAISVAITFILPDMDISAYLQNLVANLPSPLAPLDDFIKNWNEVSVRFNEVSQGLASNNVINILEGIADILMMIVDVLFVLPIKVVGWAINTIIVIFGGAVGSWNYSWL